MNHFEPIDNYNQTLKEAGYISRHEATQKDYDRIGFKSGLEVHQQLKTEEKLFCRCPAGVYHNHDKYDAEVIRHMRPTLSELGEYDGTALMEFKTRKEIIYRLKNESTCTYEVDDTPPFPMNETALDISLRISLLSRLNIVGEVHVTRKQYLDGSIPTGFQRTAIIGVEGEIYLRNKTVRLIQLSLEEDSCREISDYRHTRVYNTDRLGMPLIETVTYHDMANPDEVQEACDYIRFLNRSTGMVRTGIGTGRQDVNVSCRGGSRVEIKGVSHTKWIPELTHNESFRQWSLLLLRDKLNKKVKDRNNWKIHSQELNYYDYGFTYQPIVNARDEKNKIIAVNLPGFRGALSHFTQPGKVFGHELEDRISVVACLERPNMTHSESLTPVVSEENWQKVRKALGSKPEDAQVIFWGPEEDIATALETIEERCNIAFEGIPRETRKSFRDGTTIFERVLPGPDRMYPDTDTPPIPLSDQYIESVRQELPTDVIKRYRQLKKWGVPEDTYNYIFKKNLFPLINEMVEELGFDPVFIGTLIGHQLKWVEGHYSHGKGFNYKIIKALLRYVKENNLDKTIAEEMLPVVYVHPRMDFDSVLANINYQPQQPDEILSRVPYLHETFKKTAYRDTVANETDWIVGQLRKSAVGNMDLKVLKSEVEKILNHQNV
ncbi:MAG: Glu-tRNA(Gln) amidotransferase subunit GatE [Bacteroidales bacterium]|nr:Glu-tRNA(Gln) amidotransferase subunit GatE [Bacteroidales bacterium]MCF8337570.1 Glu-tRNA(Gln) amidotransferase subunit GatE [Bacteroidales bacterium]